MLLPETQTLLRAAGWSPEQRIDDDQVQRWVTQYVKEYGCTIFPEAVRILREYGNMALWRDDPERRMCLYHDEMIAPGDPEWLFGWQWDLETVLFPFSTYSPQNYSYAVDPTGKIYARGMVDIECGASFEEAINNLLLYPQNLRVMHELVVRYRNDNGESERMYEAVKEGWKTFKDPDKRCPIHG